MADDNDNEKTQLPSQRRRDDARAQGQFAYSHELNNGLLLFAGALGLWWGGLTLAQGLSHDLHSHIAGLRVEMTVDETQSLFVGLFGRGLQLAGALMAGMFVMGLAVNLGQAGLHINSESLGPKWEKLNPAMNWRQLVSVEGLTRGGFALAKVGLIGVVVWWILSDRIGEVVALGQHQLAQSVAISWDIGANLLIAAAAILLMIGATDYGLQWFRNEKKLMMSREDMKQEKKDDEGDPHVLAKRRQRAREIVSQRRMLEQVPKATIVISNPTHFAVALRYERGEMSAPLVIAKGRDQFALLIMARARRHGIPVIERKPVAQALYKTVKVGQEIPQALYLAVSEVLSYVYRLRGTAA
ncbi:MAG: EscU/YscU/HrcU family type III secretion system export apparatus switch protein [Planctomycetota bacterium]